MIASFDSAATPSAVTIEAGLSGSRSTLAGLGDPDWAAREAILLLIADAHSRSSSVPRGRMVAPTPQAFYRFASDVTLVEPTWTLMLGNASATPSAEDFQFAYRSYASETVIALDELRQLSENWNGNGGVPPTPVAIEEAKSVYSLLTEFPRPTVEPSGDGEVNFVWKSKAGYLELGLSGDGMLSFYGKVGGTEHFGDYDVLPTKLPPELRAALDAFVHERV